LPWRCRRKLHQAAIGKLRQESWMTHDDGCGSGPMGSLRFFLNRFWVNGFYFCETIHFCSVQKLLMLIKTMKTRDQTLMRMRAGLRTPPNPLSVRSGLCTAECQCSVYQK